MKFGIFALPTYHPDIHGTIGEFYTQIVEMMAAAEQYGFESAWVNEHHFHAYGGMMPSPNTLLAALAMRTSRIRLGTSVSLLPLHDPLETAEAYAMVDQLSGGRLEFGIGVGFMRYDYETIGVPFDEGVPRLMESLAVIRQAWQQQPFSHHGRYFNYDDVAVWPPPLQRPHPPIWGAASRNPETFEWIGRAGYGLLTVVYLHQLARMAELIGHYRAAAADAGHDPATLPVATHYQVYCAEDGAEARRVAEQALRSYIELSNAARALGHVRITLQPEDMVIDRLIAEARVCVGTPDECAAVLERANAELGLTSVDCTFCFGDLDYARAQRSMDLFAREVMPRFRTEAVGAAVR